ncbi:Hydroxyacyl-coenzyme A dehydrogenase, mitochondrial [Aphelenchoides besseyi]|nr:Hydroxyacyl-coenzyme A dehydrogenase, mitochondrial [Aphelenchoides besseyi]KAI6236496.1 Hydroxyacyl-coenzyme A dehydrogenase, mitochondrial [Aphelenchoides besseyi]
MEIEGKENGLPFHHVVIAGANGTMGSGIGQCALQFGYKTTLLVRTQEKAIQARRLVEQFVEKKAKKLFADDHVKAQSWLNERLAKLHTSTDLRSAVASADLFIEAIVENKTTKQDLLEEVENAARPGTVLVTNTSSLKLSDVGAKLSNPQYLGGLHFLSPVAATKLVEVVKADFTLPDVSDRLQCFAESLGKTTILCKDSPGFVFNRLMIPLLNMAHCLVDDGIASCEDIDVATKVGMNLPMGILSLSDLIGLDTIANANKEAQSYGVMDLKTSHTLNSLVANNCLGRKTGKGFFDYSKDAKN